MAPETFGPFMAEQRKKHQLTQSQLAQLLHVSTAAVSKWERGLCLPEVSKLEDIAAVFHLNLMEVMQCRESEDIPKDVEAVLTDTIRLTKSESRRKTKKWVAALVLAASLCKRASLIRENETGRKSFSVRLFVALLRPHISFPCVCPER